MVDVDYCDRCGCESRGLAGDWLDRSHEVVICPDCRAEELVPDSDEWEHDEYSRFLERRASLLDAAGPIAA